MVHNHVNSVVFEIERRLHDLFGEDRESPGNAAAGEPVDGSGWDIFKDVGLSDKPPMLPFDGLEEVREVIKSEFRALKLELKLLRPIQ